MTTDRDLTRLVRSWLEEGVTALPDHALDAVLDQVSSTRQRRNWWPAWRFGPVNVSSRLFAVAASIVIVVVAGATFLPVIIGPATVPTPSPNVSPSPHPGATVQPSPSEPIETPLPAGTYSLEGYPVSISFTVPAGWQWCSSGTFEEGVCRERGNGGVQFMIVDNVVADSCGRALHDPPVGPSVDDLVAALSGLAQFTATAPVDVTVDGFAGKEFTLTSTSIPGGCGLYNWATKDRVNGVGLGESNLLRVIDVDGTRIVMSGSYPRLAADAGAAVAAMKQVMDSVTFTP